MKSKILYLVCLAYFISGFQVYNTSVPSLKLLRQADPSITAHTNIFTLHEIGLVFMLSTAVCAAITLFWNKSQLGYSIITFLLTWWGLLYLVSWIQTGYWQSIYGTVGYGLTVSILILCSRIVESPPGMRESFQTPLPLEELTANLKKINDIEGGKP